MSNVENNNIATPVVLSVGDVFNAQLGNPSDSSGYVESAEVVVLAHDNAEGALGRHCYLIMQLGTNLVGLASMMYDRNTASFEPLLYCTNARRIGSDNFKTLSSAAKSLGFII